MENTQLGTGAVLQGKRKSGDSATSVRTSTPIIQMHFKAPRHLGILQYNLNKNRETTDSVLNDPSSSKYALLLLQEQYWSNTPNHLYCINHEHYSNQNLATTHYNIQEP